LFVFLGEAEFVRGNGEEEAFDGVEGAVGEDVDGVDDVVEEGLEIWLLGAYALCLFLIE
jgi:hypothetical protein